MTDMKKMYTKHGDGIQDPNLVIECDPNFKGILGSSVNRRELLQLGAAASAAGFTLPSSSPNIA